MVPKKPIAIDISLGHGQAAWVLAHGAEPDEQLLGKLKYLRRRGVPFSPEELGGGRGKGVRYGLHHVVELAVALFLDARGHRLHTTADRIIDSRDDLREDIDQIYRDTPPQAFEADWIFSMGRSKIAFEKTVFFNLSPSGGGGRAVPHNPRDLSTFGIATPQVSGWGPGDAVVPLKHLVIEAVGLSRRAPYIRPGRP